MRIDPAKARKASVTGPGPQRQNRCPADHGDVTVPPTIHPKVLSHKPTNLCHAQKGKAFEWTKEAEQALDELIRQIASDPQISHPNPDKPFELEIDASNYATGAVFVFKRRTRESA